MRHHAPVSFRAPVPYFHLQTKSDFLIRVFSLSPSCDFIFLCQRLFQKGKRHRGRNCITIKVGGLWRRGFFWIPSTQYFSVLQVEPVWRATRRCCDQTGRHSHGSDKCCVHCVYCHRSAFIGAVPSKHDVDRTRVFYLDADCLTRHSGTDPLSDLFCLSFFCCFKKRTKEKKEKLLSRTAIPKYSEAFLMYSDL